MISLLDTLGPAIWRASWQGAVLALLITLLAWCFGERLSPRWRYLLWSVVVMRLLVVATPVSPWSIFNLARWNLEASDRSMAQRQMDAPVTPVLGRSDSKSTEPEASFEWRQMVDAPLTPSQESSGSHVVAPPNPPSVVSGTAAGVTPTITRRFDAVLITRILSLIWLTGCLWMILKLAATALVLRRRLSACCSIADTSILALLETCRLEIGLKHTPALLVTPESLSPCIVGIWNPRIVLPEAFVTQSSAARLRHVLSHELAHLVRGDLWTNWLLLAARVLHWFNPVAWWTVRQMQSEREAACDDFVLAASGKADRAEYAATIVELAASLPSSVIVPGLIGFFSSTNRLQARVERLLRSRSNPALRTPIATGLLLGVALLGLTDSMPGVQAQAPQETPSTEKSEPNANMYTINGRCVDHTDSSPLPGITVRLFQVEGRTSLPVEIATDVTDVDGRYTFTRLIPPRPEGHLDRLNYAVVGFTEDRPIGINFIYFRDQKQVVEIRMAREKSTLSGKVADAAGQPVAGATVMQYWIDERPIPGVLSATTDADGRFEIENVAIYKLRDGKTRDIRFAVLHPDHPQTSGKASSLPADVVVTLAAGCEVTGTVTDALTGGPAAGAVITARRIDVWDTTFVATDAAGRFRVVVPEGRYDFLVDAKDRVCVAVTGRECLAGQRIELPPFTLVGGGFITGQVVNTQTGRPVSITESGEPIMLGLFGPSEPAGPVISPIRLAAVDRTGRFILRAAPGENFPYFVNTRGARMAWDTRKQPPVIVEGGETTTYNMLITPPVPPEEKLRAARQIVEKLSEKPNERTAQILLEFRKLNRTVDETELWCLLMRELVAVGRDAVPQLCAELDRTIEDRMLRRLGFALRAIGDPRAVPALIRAFPKTLLPSSSDYGLVVGDKELTEFMQTHDLDKGNRGTHFGFKRPVREIVGALHTLTGQSFDDAELFYVSLSEGPRRQILQRRLYQRQAQRWQAWWEANWQDYTNDAAYQKVNLNAINEALPRPAKSLGPTARLNGVFIGVVLSPATEEGQHAWHAYDLDTGYRPNWPSRISKDYAAHNPQQLDEWASQSGVDLICTTFQLPDGSETYVLRALGMKVREISPRDLRNLDRLIAAGRLPEGRPVGELLMHYDTQSQKFVPDANAAFLFTTREGSIGVIETTDRVTRTANLTGLAGNPPQGAGFHLGVRFNLKAIIP